MTPRILSCTPTWNGSDLDEAVAHIGKGGLVVLPTDTVYGIGARAHDPRAVAAVLAAKGRGRQMPPPVLVASHESIDDLAVEVPASAYRLASTFWPGGLTLILTARPDLGWDLGETGGTLALRMPDDARTLALLERTGPMAVTSANLTGHAPATRIEDAIAYFGDTAVYIDGGPTSSSTPSSIVDLAHVPARAIRLGTLSLEELSDCVDEEILPVASPTR